VQQKKKGKQKVGQIFFLSLIKLTLIFILQLFELCLVQTLTAELTPISVVNIDYYGYYYNSLPFVGINCKDRERNMHTMIQIVLIEIDVT
jgi:hypothetical protein